MAEVLAQIQEDYPTCQICQCQFNKPKALPCLHTFCETCLREFVYSRHYDQIGHFPCPVCRQEIRVPSRGVESFPYNHLVVSLLDTLHSSHAEDETGRSEIASVQSDGIQVDTETTQVDERENNQEAPQTPPVPRRPRRVAPNPPVDNDFSLARPRPNPTNTRLPRPESQLVPVVYDRRNLKLSFGKYGQEFTDFTKPVGLAVSANHIVVSDERDNRLLVFDWSGRLKSLFTCQGKIHDIALTHRGNVVVANSKAGQALAVQYSLNGHRVAAHGNMFEFEKPHGIAVLNKDDDIVVSAVETNTLFILGEGGKLVQKFASRSQGPRYLAVGDREEIIVSNYESHCIKVFNKLGKNIIKFGEMGLRPGQLKFPMGVCTDANGNIIVADSGNQRVQVFTPKGELVEVVLDYRGQDGLLSPVNVAIGRNKWLVVLLVGPNTAHVCVYPYRSKHKKAVVSSVCVCQ